MQWGGQLKSMKEAYAFIIKSTFTSMCFLSRKVDKSLSRTKIECSREKEKCYNCKIVNDIWFDICCGWKMYKNKHISKSAISCIQFSSKDIADLLLLLSADKCLFSYIFQRQYMSSEM